MHMLRTRLAAVAAILLATLVVTTASADTGPDSYEADAALEVSTPNGGTAAERPPTVEPSGGVAGPSEGSCTRSSQLPGFQEEPPQVEPPPEEEPAPPPEETPEEPGEVPDEEAGEAPTGTAPAPGGAGGGLPSTGLELAALALVGLGLLLAGLVLRRRPT
jgi:LPXTG-motif cell wall-anchored protein